MTIVINVEVYGDFDIPTTYAVMLAPNGMTAHAVTTAAKLVEQTYSKTTDANDAVRDLKALGFEVCKTYDCTVGGDL